MVATTAGKNDVLSRMGPPHLALERAVRIILGAIAENEEIIDEIVEIAVESYSLLSALLPGVHDAMKAKHSIVLAAGGYANSDDERLAMRIGSVVFSCIEKTEMILLYKIKDLLKELLELYVRYSKVQTKIHTAG